jgi:lipoprotein-anchoring transpeptidase ErfK/SrfK
MQPRTIAAALAVAFLCLSCASGAAGSRTGEPAPSAAGVAVQPKVRAGPLGPDPDPSEAVVATARVDRVKAFRRPGAEEPFVRLDHPNQYGTPTVFLVDRIDGRWLRAYLPMRPNEVRGWIRRGDVSLYSTEYRIVVDTGDNRLMVWKGARRIMSKQVAAGTDSAPTPTGQFYVSLLAEFSEGSAYGPFAFGISAYSEVYQTFGGGDGQVAIHGTDDPSSIGLDVSHGCIRLPNRAILELKRRLPLGTPVRIRR